MTISRVTASSDQTLSATSDTLVDSMTITPAAGDYLVLFTGYLENGGTAKNYEFSIYVGGSIVQHTERACKIEGSIAATAVMSCVATHAWVTVNGSQAIEIRYRRTAGTTSSTMKRRGMSIFPNSSSNFQQATATANTTISATSDTQLTSMTLTPGAGTYLLLFSTSADNAAAGISVFYSVYVNSVQVAHSEREFWAEASISANLGAMPVLIGCVVTPTAGQVVEIRARRVTNNWTNYERTLTLMKVDAADIKEASATDSPTGTGTSYEDIGGTPLRVTDPGVADWLTIFSSSKRYGTIGVHETTNVSIFNAGSQVTDTELLQTHNSSIDNADYAIFTHGKITVAGATDDVEVKWLGDTTTTRTMKQRTLVMVREAAPAGDIAGTADMVFANSAALAGSGALAGTSSPTFANTAALSGSGALAGSADFAFTDTATLDALAEAAGTISISFSNSGTMAGDGALAGVSSPTFSNTATLEGAGALAGVSAPVFANTATLGGDGALVGASFPTFSLSGTLELPSGFIEGTVSMVFANTATLTGDGALAGAANPVFANAATLTGEGALAGSIPITFSNTADISFTGTPVTPVVEQPGGRRRRRQRVVYRLFYKGKPLLFDDVESLVAFLERQELEAERRVERVATRDARRIERVGRAAPSPRPPLVRLRSEVPEIRDYITDLQRKLDSLYWRKLEARLLDELDEEDDLVILASVLRV